MKRIKVLHIITKLELGGAQRFTLFTFDSLSRDIFDVYLATGTGGVLDEKVKGREHVFFIKNLKREISFLKDIKAYFEIKNLIKNLNPQIVHTHSSKAGILGRWAAKSDGVPIIIHTVHGFGFSPYHSLLKRWIFRVLEKITSRITDRLFFVSKDDFEKAKEFKIQKEGQGRIVRSIVPIKPFIEKSFLKERLRKKFNFPEGFYVVGGVFPFKEQKDPVGFIKIAKRVLKEEKKVFFAIAGDGYLREKVEKAIKKFKIQKHFRLYGWIEEIDEFIPSLDLLLLPSLWEGLPQSSVQAIAGCIPVVSTDVNGLKEVVIDGITGYTFKPKNYSDAAIKVIKVLKGDIPKEKFLSERRRIIEEFNSNRQIKLHEKIYIELVKEKLKNSFSIPDVFPL